MSVEMAVKNQEINLEQECVVINNLLYVNHFDLNNDLFTIKTET
jgi:hypothetical protein